VFTFVDDTLAASNNVSTILLVLMRRQMSKFKAVFEYKQEIAKIEADPTNEENQAKIAEQIRLQNIKANMELAMEELPEVCCKFICDER